MSARGWLSLRQTWNQHYGRDRVDGTFVGNILQKLQTSSANVSVNLFVLPFRSISSAGINKKSSDGKTDGPGTGKSREPGGESQEKGKGPPEGSEDKRMWRKWIEQRLAQSDRSVEEIDIKKGSRVGGALKNSFKGSMSDDTVSEEAKDSRSESYRSREMLKRPLLTDNAKSSEGKSSSLDSIFRAALKSSSNAGKGDDTRPSSFRNPFRREDVKSIFLNEREKRGSLFQESSKRPAFLPARQSPDYTRKPPSRDLPEEALEEFESRVVGKADDENGSIDDDFMRDLDAIGRSARGLLDDDDNDLDNEEEEDWGDEKAAALTDLALANSKEFDLEDEENPYRMRSDRLFFPGQTYDPEDLDLSKAADSEKPTVRTRKRYPSKEVYQIADFRNPRYLSNFIRETSRILSRRHFQFSGKAQRKVAREIKTARILGLMPFTSMGDPPFRFLRSRSEEEPTSRIDDY